MKKIISGLITAGIVISLLTTFTSCIGNDDGTTAAAGTDSENTTQIDITNAEAGINSTVYADDTTANTKASMVNGNIRSGNTNTQNSHSKPATISEIVAYYNTAANKVKKDKPGYTLTTTNYVGSITSDKSTIEILAKTVIKIVNIDPTTVSIPKGSNGDFPVKGQSYGSRLDPSAVKSAVCTDNGSAYEITLKFKVEKLSDLPKDPAKTNHGKAMNLMTAGEFYQQTDKFKGIVKVQKFAPTYSGSYIKCTVDKSTGNLKTATYYLNTIATVKAKPLIGSLNATVPLAIKEEYTLRY